MLAKTFIFTLFIATGYCDEARIEVLDKHGANGDENELITIDLQRKDGSEDIKLIVQLRFHLVEGMVHLNGTRLFHNTVNSVSMRLTVIEMKKGLLPIHKIVPVHLRILVLEEKAANGNKILFIEEEFVQVEDYEVLQVDVKQIIWESMVRKPVTVISLKESKIHALPRKSDVHILVKDDVLQPHLPDEHGLQDDEHHHYHCHHHHDHYHGNHSRYHHGLGSKAKCWYRHLSWKSKLSLFSIGFLSVIALVLCCALYAKRRRRRRTLEVNAPIDDSVSVDMEDVKKDTWKKDDKCDFHFELDNAVVVDDKQTLVN